MSRCKNCKTDFSMAKCSDVDFCYKCQEKDIEVSDFWIKEKKEYRKNLYISLGFFMPILILFTISSVDTTLFIISLIITVVTFLMTIFAYGLFSETPPKKEFKKYCDYMAKNNGDIFTCIWCGSLPYWELGHEKSNCTMRCTKKRAEIW